MTPRERASDPPESLVDLGRLAQAGCARALDALLRRVEPPLYRYFVSRLRAAPDAADLARDLCQDALIRAMTAMGRCTFSSDGRLLAWVFTIARNVLLDHLRQQRARAEVRGEACWAGAEARACAAEDETSPIRLLVGFASEALAEVPEATAELLRLRLVGGSSWKEVADALGIAESAAKRRFQRAQVSLRRRILARVDALPPAARRAAFQLLPEPGAAPPPGEGAAFRSPATRPGQ